MRIHVYQVVLIDRENFSRQICLNSTHAKRDVELSTSNDRLVLGLS